MLLLVLLTGLLHVDSDTPVSLDNLPQGITFLSQPDVVLLYLWE